MVPIVFAHGLEGSPNGRKIEYLRTSGFDVVAPDGRGLTLAERLVGLEAATRGHGILLIGSSYGGLAAAHLAMLHPERFLGLLLLAPALHYSEPPVSDVTRLCPPPGVPTMVMHGLGDQVVPIESSRRYAEKGAALLEVADDHSLAASLVAMADAVYAMINPQT
jgi:pimeloyl-ACP methyl ester carboxylesterase